MKTAIVLLALLAAVALSYDFTRPESGAELKATLKDEKDQTFVVFFHDDVYEGDDKKDSAKLLKDLKEDVQKECTKLGLKDSDYTYIDVEIKCKEGKETLGDKPEDKKKTYAKLLETLGFETPKDDKVCEKLEAAPYSLVMRNQQGYRVSGANIAKELCYQADQFKKLAEKQASANKK